ncbi:hypothetical protein Zmor_005329 [Zophobas morio]|uniref:Sfi1 spindle body domain-containing protein n=1 Tax=Zophobas morio TaxID=2755281 RepID=A0AA38IP83_9CUCU|nr:hypothetical protein Zmor_005329 [Zophobas morio]
MQATTDYEKKKLLKKCFDVWRRVVKVKTEKEEIYRSKVQQREKLDNLVKALKKYRKENQEDSQPTQVKVKEAPTNFKSRFEAQKHAIEKLTLKIEEKDRVIEELKLGIFDREALKSLNETKIEIREIFANCSTKVRCKIAPPPDYSEKFMISTQKAPKIVQEVEERALERAKRRELILERKKIIQENRQRMIVAALERKRIQDEDEKKRSLEQIKERRRKELEMRQIRERNKLIFFEKVKIALGLYNRTLQRKAFQGLFENYTQGKENYERSKLHYKITLLSKVMHTWTEFMEDKYRDKNALADAVYAKNIVSRALQTWREFRIESIRSMQVAEDFYDLLLLNNTFVHWHRNVCIRIMLTHKKMDVARKHHDRRILFHSFYQWRSLPAVIQLEKSKEMKMKKWREKVWAILPNYKPPSEDDYF